MMLLHMYVYVHMCVSFICVVDSSLEEVRFENCDSHSSAFSKLFSTIHKAVKDLDANGFQVIKSSCVSQAEEPLQSLLQRASDSHCLFGVLAVNHPYCNWMRIYFLEVIASAYGESLENVVRRYKNTIFSKPLGEIWNRISDSSVRHKYQTELKASFTDIEDPENISVNELIRREPQLAKKIELEFAQIRKGSLLVTWFIPTVKLYQAYLSFLAVSQQSRMDTSLQFGTWVAYLPQYVIQEQQKKHGKFPYLSACNLFTVVMSH